MLALKYGHQLCWADLQYVENPLVAKLTLKSNHGAKVGGDYIQNACEHNLPDERTRSFDPYGQINQRLENGQVFLVNSNTTNPLFTKLGITEHNTAKWEILQCQCPFMENSVDAVMQHITVPKVHGVLRQEAKEQSTEEEETKVEREKHCILLELEGQNNRPLPLKHNITLYVENTTQGTTAVRQLNEVIYNPLSRVFTTNKGDQLKVYVIPDGLLEVKKDLNENKSVANSESKGLIAALSETGQETRDDGALLHHFKYQVPNNVVEVQLLDEDDEPEENVLFQVVNSNGKVLGKGRTDEAGYGVVTGIEYKDVEIVFPELDVSYVEEA